MTTTLTDGEIDRIQRAAMDGTMTEEEYERLTSAAIEDGERLLADPEMMEVATANPFVPAPQPGEALFRTCCVRRGDGYTGQFNTRTDAHAAKGWAIANLPGYRGCRVRTLRNYLPTLGHPLYELKVYVAY